MSTPELPTDQGIWLGVLSGRDELVQAEVAAAASPGLASVQAALLRCQEGTTLDELEDASPAERRSSPYWHLRVWRASLNGTEDITARKIVRIMTGAIPTADAAAATLNPLNESSALSGDVWGYRRPPIVWADAPVQLPSPAAGAAQWLIDPRQAAATAGLLGRVPLCDPADWSAATRQPSG
jgi:hypothetical protein